jgi:hypothetical protein
VVGYTDSEKQQLHDAIDRFLATTSGERRDELMALANGLHAARHVDTVSHVSRDVVRVLFGGLLLLGVMVAVLDLSLPIGMFDRAAYETASCVVAAALGCLETVWCVRTWLLRRRIRRDNNRILDIVRMPPGFPRL